MGLFGPSLFETIRSNKDAQRTEAIHKASQLIASLPVHSEEEIIIKSPAWELAEKIKAGQWSACTVVTAFARRCIEAHKETNCLTESNFKNIFEKES